jgi:hypothetical protein
MAVKINVKQNSLLPALFGFGPEVAVTALPALGRLNGVGGVAVHAYSLVKEPGLSLFETCHSIFL